MKKFKEELQKKKVTYQKWCSKCGEIQEIIPIQKFNDRTGKHDTIGICYTHGHFMTKNPYAKKYEVEN